MATIIAWQPEFTALVVAAALFSVGCAYLADGPQTGATAQPPLKVLAAKRGLNIGVCVSPEALRNDPGYGKLLAEQFDIVTPENAMKFAHIQPERGTFTWDDADQIVDFAVQHGMKIRSHTALWHHAVPEWIADGAFARRQWEQIAKDQIAAIAQRYGDRLTYWDVVNEAIADDGQLRETIWLKTLGPDYLEKAYRWAHAAAPNVKLVYNDYGAEMKNAKSDAIYAMARDFLDRGVPLHAIGFQMHFIKSMPDPRKIAENLRRFAELGLELHVTELDIAIQKMSGTRAEQLEQQADLYRRVMEVCLSVKAVTVFQMWGLDDGHSWVPWFTKQPDAALLFDRDYQPKPAYHAVTRTLAEFQPDADADASQTCPVIADSVK